MANYDIIIKSGSVIDGTGKPAVFADIGIKGATIAALGALGNAKAEQVIDAYGKLVTPGFIDVTNHSDTHLTLFTQPNLESLLMQGVTTILGGNCGGSLAPLASEEAIGAIKKWADPSEINRDWSTVKEFLESVDRIKPGVNFGTFAGYGTLRRGIIGDEVRALNFEERERLKHMLRDAMEQGAFGLSLGLSYGHERVSTTEEITEIAQALQKKDGLVKLHLRSEGSGVIAAVNEAVRIAREGGVPVAISHLKTIGKKAWKQYDQMIDLIRNARASGVRITFDVSPYATTGSPLYLLIPEWARQGGFNELFRRIDSPHERMQIVNALQTRTLHYDKIFIISAKLPTAVGHTLAEISAETGLPPEEALLQTVRSNEGRVTIIGKTVSATNIARAIGEEYSLIASDGEGYNQEIYAQGNLVHPRSFGAFPRFWHKFVISAAALTPENAVQKLTSQPAQTFSIQKRGALEEGNFADIAVFDPNLFKDRATYKNPFRFPAGIGWVLVNGKVAVENGKITQVRAGRAIRKS